MWPPALQGALRPSGSPTETHHSSSSGRVRLFSSSRPDASRMPVRCSKDSGAATAPPRLLALVLAAAPLATRNSGSTGSTIAVAVDDASATARGITFLFACEGN